MPSLEQAEPQGSSRPSRSEWRRTCWLLLLSLPLGGIVGYSLPRLLSRFSSEPEVLFQLADAPGRNHEEPANAGAAEFEAFRKSQRVLIRQRFLINRAIASTTGDLAQQLGVDSSALPEWIEKHVQVDFPSTQILRLRLRGTAQREAAASLLSALADAYLAEIRTSEFRRITDRLNNIELASKEAEKEMQRMRRELQQLMAGNEGRQAIEVDTKLSEVAAMEKIWENLVEERSRTRGESQSAGANDFSGSRVRLLRKTL